MSCLAIVTLRNEMGELVRLEGFVTAYCQKHGIPSMELNLVAEECFVNVVEHGFEDNGPHRIELSLDLQDNCVTMTLEDDGVPFDPLSAPDFDPKTPMERRRAGGLGIHLMRSLMGELNYQRVDGRNRLTMRKRINA